MSSQFGGLKKWAGDVGHKTRKRAYETLYAELREAGLDIPETFKDPEQPKKQKRPVPSQPPVPAENALAFGASFVQLAVAQTTLQAQVADLSRRQGAAETRMGKQAANISKLDASLTNLKKVVEASTEEVKGSIQGNTALLQSLCVMLKGVAPPVERKFLIKKVAPGSSAEVKNWLHSPQGREERKERGILFDTVSQCEINSQISVTAVDQAAFTWFREKLMSLGLGVETL